MKTTDVRINERTLHLCLNGAALFDIYDKFGTDRDVPELIHGSGRESFRATVWILWKLAEQGELVRRYQGHDRSDVPRETELLLMMDPLDILAARRGIIRAWNLGFRREEQDPHEEVDLGLIELQKKTAPALPGQSIWIWLRNFLASLFGRR